jgi:hypothetical protein
MQSQRLHEPLDLARGHDEEQESADYLEQTIDAFADDANEEQDVYCARLVARGADRFPRRRMHPWFVPHKN